MSAIYERIFCRKIVSADIRKDIFSENMAQGYGEMGLNYKRTSTQEKGWSSESCYEFDKCAGDEILFDMNAYETIMGQMFYEKWRKVNTE